MCGYQGWFRARGDGSGEGWRHFGADGRFDPDHVTIDLWPDMSEYETSYATPFTLEDGSQARVFSSWDASTIDLHFRWMSQYGVDGAFMQRFYDVTRNADSRGKGRVILGNAIEAADREGRAIAVMYDLSGMRANGDDCGTVIEDWKELVDELRMTSRGDTQPYLYHNGKPLVAIWGIGFTERPYDMHQIGIDRLLDFLKDDPVYGGCSVMLGVPTYFRTLDRDCHPDPYLHKLIGNVDIVMPWMVGRFTPLSPENAEKYQNHIERDIAWCDSRGVDYAPVVYPGFSWRNLSQHEFDGLHPLNQTPRNDGRFYWARIHGALAGGASMIYVAMFDELDEGTAIFKCSHNTPREFPCVPLSVASDHYLRLTGLAASTLRGEIPLTSSYSVLFSKVVTGQ